jgi:acid phosphatase type 7
MRSLVLALLSFATVSAQSPFLEKPYLQLGNSPEAAKSGNFVLMWHTDAQPASWSVEVRTSKDKAWRPGSIPVSQKISVPGIAPHLVYRADLTKLIAGEEFQYRVLKAGEPVFEASARARKSASQAQHFVVFGDIAQGTPGQKMVASQVASQKPDFVFVAGDIVYSSGRVSEYREKFFPVYNADQPDPSVGAPLLRSVPFIAAPGNHDTALRNLERFPDALAYFYYWDQPLNGPLSSKHVLMGTPEAQAALRDSARQRYPVMANFSFDYGNAHWTVLDSNPYMDWNDAALREWVAKDLENARHAKWRFVGFHHPGFNSAKTHLTDQWMRLLAPVFEKGKVDVVFAGHVHNYQRTYPMAFAPKLQADGKWLGPKGEVAGDWTLDREFEDGGKHKPKGIIYVVTGGGGANLYNPEQQDDPASMQPFTQKYFAAQNSFTVVDIDDGTFRLKQISGAGKEIDTFQIVK